MTHDFDWIKNNIKDFPDVKLKTLLIKIRFALMGPNSRSI